MTKAAVVVVAKNVEEGIFFWEVSLVSVNEDVDGETRDEVGGGWRLLKPGRIIYSP